MRTRGGRLASATTRARRARAMQGEEAARRALKASQTLRLSNRTNIEAGIVHHSTARKLVARRVAAYPPDPRREGWFDMTRIVAATLTQQN